MATLGIKSSEEEIIGNSEAEHLYLNDSNGMKFGNITFEEKEFEVSKRIRITLVISSSGKLQTFKLKKIKYDKGEWKEETSMSFSSFSIEKIASFLSFLIENISTVKEGKIELSEISTTNNITKKQITDFLSTNEGGEILQEVLNNNTSKEDIVNIGYRKEQLNVFDKLLKGELDLITYRDEEYKNNNKIAKKFGLTDKSIGEKIWQYFFQKNEWIFGYGLDYRFMGIIQRETSLNPSTAGGKDEVKGDYLIGDNNFVHFVELKLPTTPLFGSKRNRANSWELSNDLFDAKSQILEQKASGLIKFEQKHKEYDSDGNEIEGNAYDSKTILIIGNLDEELKKETITLDKQVKAKTFELFRNDSKNIKIITYNELYKRAYFIVYGIENNIN